MGTVPEDSAPILLLCPCHALPEAQIPCRRCERSLSAGPPRHGTDGWRHGPRFHFPISLLSLLRAKEKGSCRGRERLIAAR